MELPKSFINQLVSKSENVLNIRSNVKNIEDINKWVKEYGDITNTQWNARTSKPNGKQFACLKKFVCHHSSFMKVSPEENKKGHSKNCDCTAKIDLKEGLVGQITIYNNHNHTLNTAESLKFLPATATEEVFIEYFNDGMTVAEACKFHLSTLQMKEDYNEMEMANNRLNPINKTVYHWHNKWRLMNLGPRSGIGLIEKLKEKIETYGEKGITVKFRDNPFAVVILTPLMKRAHELQSAGEIAFVDTTSSCDADNHAITFILTPSTAGAVPLGIIITRGQTEQAYEQGFELLKNVAGSIAFNGKGSPLIFITDNSQAEINALRKTWPTSINLLCIFHIGQAVWRWLWDSNNNIPKDSRQILMSLFQSILHSSCPSTAQEAFLNLQGYVGTYLPTYPQWNAYVNGYWEFKEMWCLGYRNEKVRGHHTNNFTEVCVRIFKDNVLCRVKAYNMITLIDFSVTVLEQYYQRRLLEFANSRDAGPRLFLQSVRKSALDAKHPISKKDIEKIEAVDHQFVVKSTTDNYIVDVLSACCSCPAGMYGKFCKHQFAISYFFNVYGQNFPAVTTRDRYEIARLALGEKVPPMEFYQPFRGETEDLVLVEQKMQTPHLIIPTNEMEDSPTSCEEECNRKEELKKEFLMEMSKILDKFDCSIPALEKGLSRLTRIKTEGQCETMLHTIGSNVPLRRKAGATIKVQPTSIARRSATVTRGSKRLPSGRPVSASSSKKRKHNLSYNVKLNQPNAKKH
ncbi:hypothetical protein JTE90_010878 [Oedothorax gibbosus]|uniref:SWIM-type domain-containing protein n=1 Tax=Oedothorax gibbosus TaxID=931172 RepID=A0AAV6TTE1_9ARAC|nr:hypothetical protein JTE90_010878 [Oedothorax gibbosus]